ncbi:MAG: glycosyltransferase [Prochlorococcaceae cyanobacterium]|jgi:glycosyltransferase involved in cell wall biosynthesis
MTDPLHVLHLIPSISPRRGGPSQAVLAMVGALRQRGVEARILTTNDDGPGLLSELPLGVWHEHHGVPVLAFPRWSPPGRLLRPLREFAIAPGLTGWLTRHLLEFDLLHVHALFSYASTSGMAVARHQRVPYVLRSIGQLNHWSLRQSAGRKRWLLRLIERRNLEGSAALHFTSEAERQEATALGLPTPSFVLPLGVAPQELRPLRRSTDAGVTFLFLSRLHPKKQLEVLLDALALLRDRHPAAPWRLQIAGEGDPSYRRQLQARAQRLEIADRCEWLGFVAGEPKRELLAAAHWFVLPSASENFGIAAAEALAAGTPVILSPGVAVAEAVTQAGAGVVVQANPEALAGALERALDPPSAAMVCAARQLAVNVYGWGAIAAQLEAHYRDLIGMA